MLQLTRDGEYAVRAILHLSSQPMGQVTLVNEIAEAQDVPKSYLSKIMQHLVKSGLVKSRRGARGGFILAKPADQITLRETIEAIEGPIRLNVCLVKKGEGPRSEVDPVQPKWRDSHNKLFEILDSKNMAELVKDSEKLYRQMHKAGTRKDKAR